MIQPMFIMLLIYFITINQFIKSPETSKFTNEKVGDTKCKCINVAYCRFPDLLTKMNLCKIRQTINQECNHTNIIHDYISKWKTIMLFDKINTRSYFICRSVKRITEKIRSPVIWAPPSWSAQCIVGVRESRSLLPRERTQKTNTAIISL